MSRAFVKEDDLEHAGIDVPERPVSTHPNYVTHDGLQQLTTEAVKLEQERATLKSQLEDVTEHDPMLRQKIAVIERDLRYISARLSSAILIEVASQNTGVQNTGVQNAGDQNPEAKTVLFGATVAVEDDDGQQHQFTIVGEDEADMSCNKVSYVSPIAKALIGRKLGDSVEWVRPVGNMQLTIKDIKY